MAEPENADVKLERMMASIMRRHTTMAAISIVSTASPAPPFSSTGTALKPALHNMGPVTRREHVENTLKGKFNFLRGRTRKEPYPTGKVRTSLFQFYVLPTPTTSIPTGWEELVHAQAGLGRRHIALPEESTHQEIEDILHAEYPKLMQLKGGWMFYKGGSGRSRIDTIQTFLGIPGYSTTSILKYHSGNGKRCIYIAPLQQALSTEPLPPDAPEFATMPKAACQTCGNRMPLQMLAFHVRDCNIKDRQTGEVKDLGDDATEVEPDTKQDESLEVCQICQEGMSCSLVFHASICVNRLSREEQDAAQSLRRGGVNGLSSSPSTSYGGSLPGSSRDTFPEGPSRQSWTATSSVPCSTHDPSLWAKGRDDERPVSTAWRTAVDPENACYIFTKELLDLNTGARAMRLTLDVTETPDEQDATLITFYMARGNQWASPLKCRLQGDQAVGAGVRRHILSTVINKLTTGFHFDVGQAAVTQLFHGKTDHLVPSTALSLTDSELFVMAGRMIGHTFLHGGPALTGLSPAIVNILTGGTMDTAAALLTINDCPDLEYRDIMQPLEKDFSDITTEEQENVRTQCGIWDCLSFVHLTAKNKDRVFQDLLVYAVLKRTVLEVKQLRKGLKDTGIWPLIKTRPDIVPLLFPGEAERRLDAQVFNAPQSKAL